MEIGRGSQIDPPEKTTHKNSSFITVNEKNYLTFRSMKSFSTEIYEEVLGKLTFPDYENFSYINEAYSELTSKTFEQSGTYKSY